MLGQRLEFHPPNSERPATPCTCGHSARYVELRSKAVLIAVGVAECVRAYYRCEHCHRGQFPMGVELDVENRNFRPGCAA